MDLQDKIIHALNVDIDDDVVEIADDCVMRVIKLTKWRKNRQ